MKTGGKFLSFVKRHKWSILLIVFGVLVAGYFLWDILSASPLSPLPAARKQPEKKVVLVSAPISGLQVTPEEAGKKPVAIVIENHPDARPQSGLNQAALVFETFAEGGITRFLAVFQEKDSKEIGPVRSARTYFVDWASSYKALFAHVGGNIDALDLIPKSSAFDVNQFYFGSYFWRDTKRFAPHNVYTTIAKLQDAARRKNYPTEDLNVPAFVFKKETKGQTLPAAFSFKVNFNSSFAVTWTYDPKTNYFYRSMLGAPQKDRVSNEQLRAKNILVGFTDFSYATTRYNEKATKIRTTGSGNAIIFVDGTKRAGTWKRAAGNIVRFYELDGTEVKLNPGNTWIEFAPVGTIVS